MSPLRLLPASLRGSPWTSSPSLESCPGSWRGPSLSPFAVHPSGRPWFHESWGNTSISQLSRRAWQEAAWLWPSVSPDCVCEDGTGACGLSVLTAPPTHTAVSSRVTSRSCPCPTESQPEAGWEVRQGVRLGCPRQPQWPPGDRQIRHLAGRLELGQGLQAGSPSAWTQAVGTGHALTSRSCPGLLWPINKCCRWTG